MIRAQRGDRAAFGLLAAEIATPFLAVSRRILRDLDLAEDASQQALVAIWRDLPQLRDPARFDAWSYRLLVRACYSEGRRARQWSPNIRVLPARRAGGVRRTRCGRVPGPARTCDPPPVGGPPERARPAPLRRHSGRPGGRDPGDPGRHGLLSTPSRDARHAGGTRCRRAPGGDGRLPDEHRARSPHAHRPVVASTKTPTRTPSVTSCAPSTRSIRRHSVDPGGRRGGSHHEHLRQAGDRRRGRARRRGRRLPARSAHQHAGCASHRDATASAATAARPRRVRDRRGTVSLAAIAAGSSVTAHVRARGRGRRFLRRRSPVHWTTEDGLIMIGGVTTETNGSGSALSPVGFRAGIVLKRGSPVQATVWNQRTDTRTATCPAFLDEELMMQRSGRSGVGSSRSRDSSSLGDPGPAERTPCHR